MVKTDWQTLGWEHPVWELVRYFLSLGTVDIRRTFLDTLRAEAAAPIGEIKLKLDPKCAELLADYIDFRQTACTAAEDLLRTEEEATAFCVNTLKETPKTTQTTSLDHHQSSKAMVLATTRTAEAICKAKGVAIDPNPQTRCVWVRGENLHVTARNLDGAIPGLLNPLVIWEIKEYWGKTKGGSKMSDAVYECALVGRELRDLEKRSDIHIEHVVLLDGKEQWSHRRSDLLRFCDLFYQGLIDALFIGREVETDWPQYLERVLDDHSSKGQTLRMVSPR